MKQVDLLLPTLLFWILNHIGICSNAVGRSKKDFKLRPASKGLDAILEVSIANISSDCTIRPSVTVNGTSPGPELRFKEGSHVKIRVINRLKKSNTTIHFHGISQFGSPFADGTPKVSQFAIEADGGYFDYSFYLEPGSAGTYLYHAHVNFQIVSAYGSFIVEDVKPPPYKYDEEVTMILGDYYHEPDQPISEGLGAKPFKWLGEPQSLVVNGNALGSCTPSKSRFGCTKSCHNQVFTVKPNKTYRFRVIGITALTYLYFGIEDHRQLDIVEVDGGFIKRARIDHIRIHSGQRYSFLLKTKSVEELRELGSRRDFWGIIESRWRPIRDKGAFLIRYQTEEIDNDSNRNHLKKYLSLSSNDDLSLTEAPQSTRDLMGLPNELPEWIDADFEPFDEGEVAPRADQVNRRLTIEGQQRTINGGIKWYINGEVYDETQPQVPFLAKAYLRDLKPDYEAAKKNKGYDSKLGVFPVKIGEVIELLFLNLASTSKVAEAHPWHIHGQKAFVIGEGRGPFNDTAFKETENKFPKRHIQRDTQVVLAGKGASYANTTVESGSQTGWVMMRMKAETPGAFLAHCHIQPHAMMGMAAVILVGVDQLPPLPQEMLETYENNMPEYLELRKKN